MKNCTLVASTVNDEGLWLAEIIEVEGCITQGKDLQEVVQRAKELREAIDTIKGLQFNEEEPAEDIQEKNEDDALGYFVSHKNKANGSICSNISEVLEIIKEFDILDDRGNKAFRRHLGIMITHLSPQLPTLSIGPWTIQCKSMKKQLATAPKWDGWKNKSNGKEETA